MFTRMGGRREVTTRLSPDAPCNAQSRLPFCKYFHGWLLIHILARPAMRFHSWLPLLISVIGLVLSKYQGKQCMDYQGENQGDKQRGRRSMVVSIILMNCQTTLAFESRKVSTKWNTVKLLSTRVVGKVWPRLTSLLGARHFTGLTWYQSAAF